MWYFIATIAELIWAIPMLLIQIVTLGKVRLYGVFGSEINKINKFIAFSSICNGESHYGLIIGKYFIGYVSQSGGGGDRGQTIVKLYVIMSISRYETVFQATETTAKNKNAKKIKLWYRTGHFFHIQYIKTKTMLPRNKMREIQRKVIAEIIAEYAKNEHGNCVALVSGPPDCGKTWISLFLARELCEKKKFDVSLIDSFNPTDPGDGFAALYYNINPSDKSPLIVVLNEVDQIILRRRSSFSFCGPTSSKNFGSSRCVIFTFFSALCITARTSGFSFSSMSSKSFMRSRLRPS